MTESIPSSSNEPLTGTVTRLLDRMRAGDTHAGDELFRLIYDDLHALAAHFLAHPARARAAMDGTALVGAACERLLVRRALTAENRRHLFFLFGRAMRDVLVEQARRASAGKRQARVETITELSCADEIRPTSILDLHDALNQLSGAYPQCARIIELRFFCGCTLDEVAEVLDVSVRSVRTDWTYAKAWLAERLERGRAIEGKS